MTDKRVPREPTPAMLDANRRVVCAMHEDWLDFRKRIWLAMYDAAPAAPERSHCLAPDCGQSAKYCVDHAAAYFGPAIDTLRAQRDALRAALRELAIDADGDEGRTRCQVCNTSWTKRERHAEGCLAALEDQ